MLGRMIEVKQPIDKGVVFTFKTLSNADYEELNKIISKGKVVDVKFKTVDTRSLSQNALYWQIVGDCIKNPNSSYAKKEDLHIYLLKQANVESEITWTDKPNNLKGKYRAIEILEYMFIQTNNDELKKIYICRCFGSSSKLNKKQMSELIERAIDYSVAIGVNKDYGEMYRLMNGGV